jgi:hypothetical protein
MALSPRILSLAALPALGTNTPHLRPGVHLRWTYHPLLGFPNGPVEISRASFEDGLEEGCDRHRVHISETGQGSGAPLPTALVAGQQLWCRPLTGSRGTLAMLFVVDGIAPERVIAGLRGPSGFVPVQYGAAQGSLIWVTARGVDAVSIEGPGRILDAWSLDLTCASEQDLAPLAYVGPPVGDLGNYRSAPLGAPGDAAEARVRDGAPVLTTLSDAISATSVSPAPNNDDREWDRVQALTRPDLVERYIDLLEASPAIEVTSSEQLKSVARPDAGVIEVPTYAVLMGATRDASLARWAGLSMVDLDPHQAHSLYRIRASFDLDRMADGHDESAFVRNQAERHAIDGHGLEIDDPRVVLEAFVAVVPDSRLPLPPPDLDVTHVRWLTAAPSIRRLADVQFDRPVGAVGYAWYRQNGAMRTALNAERSGTRYRLMASASRVRPGGRAWALSDGACPAEAATYGVAATDAFGRWSAWGVESLAAGTLVPPPAPVPEAYYQPAAMTPIDDALRSGTVRVVIPVSSHLPPGAVPIDTAHVRLEGAGSAVIDSQVRAVGPAEELTLVFNGPPLARGERREGLAVVATFDAGGVRSAEGTARVQAADPRPPAALSIPETLRWTTRSDALDSSRIRLEWSPQPGHASHRVYVATTRTLVPHFGALSGGAAALDAMSASSMPMADVVAALSPHSDALPRVAFELVTSTAIPAAQSEYELVLPGRSRLLYLVRVTSVGANGVEEPWSDTPALFYVAVPPTVKLQPPELSVAVADSSAAAIRLTVTLRNGQRAAAWRAFRTTKPDLAVPGKMSELTTATLALPPDSEPPPGADAPAISAPLLEFDYDDTGPTQISPGIALQPWRTYFYRAQTQAESEPGGPPGVWSDLSRPVRTTIVPNTQPPAASVTASRVGRSLRVAWTCALPARRTAIGDFRFRVLERHEGSSVARTLGSVTALTSFTLDHDYPVEAGDLPAIDYFVETIDPVGRRQLSEPARVEGDV